MLQLAVAAQLPLIATHTRDIINLTDVLKSLTKRTPVAYKPGAAPSPSTMYYFVFPPRTDKIDLPLVQLYNTLSEIESSLLLVNPPFVYEPMFDAGEVPVPKKLLNDFMSEVVSDKKFATELLRGFGGCTIKEAAELCRLTMAQDSSLTVKGIMQIRKTAFQASRGLTQVDADNTFYEPPKELVEFVKKEKTFFLTGTDPRLIPRGLLMDGPPGTGKTAASKWIAQQWGIPLYRVDIGGTKNKYVGESEANMLTNLGRLDREEPCVALLDEVEKVFATSSGDSSGTTSTMLSQLLWWLAERKSRVFVVMTTNNAKSLPKELYREGRIDSSMYFGGLDFQQAKAFLKAVLGTFKLPAGMTEDAACKEILTHLKPIEFSDPPRYSQASATKTVYDFMKTV